MATPHVTAARLIAAATEFRLNGVVWLLWPNGNDAVLSLADYQRIPTDRLKGVRAFFEAETFLRAVRRLEAEQALLARVPS